MTFFQRHPKMHTIVHWSMAALGFLLSTQQELLAVMPFIPAGSKIPRYLGWSLATVSFTKVLLGRAAVLGKSRLEQPIDLTDVAVPSSSIPSSEAITKTEKVDPERSK